MAGPQADVNDAIASVLGELPGISSLKNEQTEVLKAFLDGKDVLALLPTGFGKSLIYQIAPLVSRKLGRQNPIVVVVSPLTALIEDQIREATRIGVTATHLGDDNQRAGIINGEFQLVFGSPERFICQEQWRDMLSSTVYEENLLAVVVDEVHVTYKWGLTKDPQKQAFREAFSRLGELRSLTKEGTPILALTASAELQSTKKVVRILHLQNAHVVKASPNRLNIRLSVVKTEFDSWVCLDWIVKELRKKGLDMDHIIIYSPSIFLAGRVYNYLQSELGDDAWVGEQCSANLLIGMYHAPTWQKYKTRVVNSFLGMGSCRVVVATTALGMGLNFKTISRIVLFGPPNDMEDVLQMVGRAGRDGGQAHAVFYYNRVQMIHADQAVKAFARGEDGGNDCIRKRLYKHFEESPISVQPGHNCCSVCHRTCNCSEPDPCTVKFPEHESFMNIITLPTRTRDVDERQRALIREVLGDYKESLSQNVPLFTTDVECTGFSDGLIDSVVQNCDHIFTLGYVFDRFSIFNPNHAKEILCVISEVFDDIENIDEVLGDYPWGLSVEEEQEAFDYNFAGYFDEGLVLNVVDDIDNVEEYDYEED
ncbi:recQ-like DNA helicase BLM [Branchiostoma floridae x Branchiostoma japonicum]